MGGHAALYRALQTRTVMSAMLATRLPVPAYATVKLDTHGTRLADRGALPMSSIRPPFRSALRALGPATAIRRSLDPRPDEPPRVIVVGLQSARIVVFDLPVELHEKSIEEPPLSSRTFPTVYNSRAGIAKLRGGSRSDAAGTM